MRALASGGSWSQRRDEGAERRPRVVGQGAARDAQRSGVDQARGQERPSRNGRRGGKRKPARAGASAAPSVQAVPAGLGERAHRFRPGLPRASARTPRAPGLADPAAGSEATGAAGRSAAERTRRPAAAAQNVATAADRAAVEAWPAACRAQRGPRRSDQGGRDSWAGSAADGPCDAAARVGGAPLRAGHCTAHAAPGGVALHRTERKRRRKQTA